MHYDRVTFGTNNMFIVSIRLHKYKIFLTTEYKTIESNNFNFQNFYVNNQFGEKIKGTVFKAIDKVD